MTKTTDARPHLRILAASWEGGGNVPPTLAAIRALARRGHDVRLIADPQVRQGRAADAVVSEEVRLELVERLLRRRVFDRPGDAESRVAHDGVEATLPLDDGAYAGLHGMIVRDVHLQGLDPPLGDKGASRGAVDAPALSRQSLGNELAETGARAGHQHDASNACFGH